MDSVEIDGEQTAGVHRESESDTLSEPPESQLEDPV